MTEDRDNLPSINDITNSGEDLPSVEEFLEEESLPSVEDFIEKEEEEEIEEEVVEINDADGKPFLEVIDINSLGQLVRLINDVRKDIPDIPEVKYYDNELEQLTEQIAQLQTELSEAPEVRYYESEVEAICEQIDFVRQEIKNLPEVKYYDEQVNAIEDRIDTLQTELTNLPEVKYYDAEIVAICDAIDEVKASIPTFPKWVNEVNEVPDFSWIGKTFSVIDDDFIKINDVVENLKTRFSIDFDTLTEKLETKDFNTNVSINSKSEEINQRIDEEKKKIWKELSDTSLKIWEHHKTFKDDDKKLKKQILGEYNKLKQELTKSIKKTTDESVKTDELLLKYFNDLKEEVTSIPEIKYYDEDIKDVKSEIKALQKIVGEIKLSQKTFNEELKQLNEVALEEPHDKAQSVGGGQDPLTPIDQKFATFKDLKEHYQIFINRIQTQLAAVGGGGAGFIKDLDDVDISGLEDGYILQYNATDSKWETVENSGVGAGGTWAVTAAGIHTTKNVGIGTTQAKSTVALFVNGDIEALGNVTVGGTITYQDVRHIDAVGIITAQQGVQILNNGLNIISGIATIVGAAGTVTVGAGQTALYVDGDARVVGLLTVGRASVTIDGDNNQITIGDDVVISGSQITLGDNITLSAAASGINSAPNVLYVAKDGSDSNNGTSIDNAFLTIKAAVGAATSGTTVKVLSGNYVEDNPITLPAFSAVVGDDLRTTKVLPNNTTSDIFHVNKGCKLQNMTFSGHLAPSAAVAFPTAGATNVGGGKWKGPYVQNCTSDTTTGTGIRVDGNLAVKTKSMNVDAFTQYNQGGVGVAVTNEGYAQLVSVFTICCDKAITCHAGGQADIANSNCSFGTLGLVADGKGGTQFIGTVTSDAAISQDNVTLNIGIGQTRPYNGQIVFFGELFESVDTITVGSGGTGYTSTPTVTIDAPTGSSGENATAFATLEGESVASITIISSGSQYQTTPNVTISAPNVGSNGATATATMAPIYYTINSSTPPNAGITTLTLDENLLNAVGTGSSVHFFQQSKIVASSHTFEYIGSGNTITLATPKRGGVTIQANEVTSSNGGKVIYTSTDQAGNFRVGDDLQINQNTGTISGRAFSRSLFSEMTPFILALS